MNRLLTAAVLVLVAPGFPCGAQEFENTNLKRSIERPPYRYEGNRTLRVAFRTSPDVLRDLVPEPLVPNPDGTMTLEVSQLKIVEPNPVAYNEAILGIPVTYAGTEGVYMVALYLDKVRPITAGREVYGFPKVDAIIAIDVKDDEFHGRVVRNGTAIIDVAATLGGPTDAPAKVPDLTVFNLKLIPSAEKNAPPDIKQLVAVSLTDRKVTRLRPAKAKVTFSSTATDPLRSIPVLQVLDARYEEGGNVLGFGKVVHDYLKKEPRTARGAGRED
jgi:acetoacetate decarboxylase